MSLALLDTHSSVLNGVMVHFLEFASLFLCALGYIGIYLDWTSPLLGLALPVLQAQGGFGGNAWLEVGGA